jgi:chloride channel 3/4/5
MAGELDNALPVVRDDTLVGLIPAPDLEYALDKLDDEDSDLCIMSVDSTWADVRDQSDNSRSNLSDLSIYIDRVSVIIESQPK